jgi:hypothetical protein
MEESDSEYIDERMTIDDNVDFEQYTEYLDEEL